MNLSLLLDNAAVYEKFPWIENLVNVLHDVIAPILLVLGSVGVIYAIYLGVMLAKAENAEKREEAKKRIINVVIAIVITFVLVLLMYLFTNNLDWFIKTAEDSAKGSTDTTENGGNGSGFIGLLNYAKVFLLK